MLTVRDLWFVGNGLKDHKALKHDLKSHFNNILTYKDHNFINDVKDNHTISKSKTNDTVCSQSKHLSCTQEEKWTQYFGYFNRTYIK